MIDNTFVMGIIATLLVGFATLAFLGAANPGGIYKVAGIAKAQEGFTATR